MEKFLIYLLESSICMGVLFGFYWIFIRKETFFSLSRAFLLSSALFSLIIPFVQFTIPALSDENIYTYVLESISITEVSIRNTMQPHTNLTTVIFVVYITGTAIMLFRFSFQLIKIAKMIWKNGTTYQNGLKLVIVDKAMLPFSFFNLIFIGKDHYIRSNIKEMIAHETIHIRQKHTVDLLVLELMAIILWINPFIWFYISNIKKLHEFLADRGALSQGINISQYQQLLLHTTTGLQLSFLTNNFNYSLLKRRFIMMTKNKTSRFAGLKVLLAMPLTLLLILAFSFYQPASGQTDQQKKEYEKQKAEEAKKKEAMVKANSEGDKVFEKVDVTPEFKGGHDAFVKYLVANVKYPDKARQAGIQGKVFVFFVVDEKGRINKATVKDGIGYGCDEEALRVINEMPAWEPGKIGEKPVKVAMTIPIAFVLDDKKQK